MIGGHVNKKGGNICRQAEESECQAGVEGSGHGEFVGIGNTDLGNTIAFSPDSESGTMGYSAT